MIVNTAISFGISAVTILLVILTMTASIMTLVKVWDVDDLQDKVKINLSCPNPSIQPTPAPGPAPGPGPAPAPDPNPQPTSGPNPQPTTGPVPDPNPDPEPKPNPINVADPIVIDESSPKFQTFQEYANLLSASMNVTYQPCEDFYSYVCEQAPQSSEFGRAQEKTNELMTKAVAGTLPNFEAMNKFKALLDKCFANAKTPLADETNGNNFKTRLTSFTTLVGQAFPILGPLNAALAKPTKAKLTQIVHYLAYRGKATITGHGISKITTTDMTKAASFIFVEPQLSSRRPLYYYKKDFDGLVTPGLKEKLNDYAKKVARVQGVTLDDTQLATDLNELIEFEKVIQSAVLDPTSPGTFTEKFRFLTAAEANNEVGIIDFAAYLTEYSEGRSDALKTALRATDYIIGILNAPGLKKISDHLESSNINARTIYNYFYFHFVDLYSEELENVDIPSSLTSSSQKNVIHGIKFPTNLPYPPPIPPKQKEEIERERETVRTLANPPTDEELREKCGDELIKIPYFRDLIDRIYIEKVLPTAADRTAKSKMVQEVAQYILDGFRGQIHQLPWTAASKRQANTKLDNLQQNILHQSHLFDDARLNTDYTTFSLDDARSFRAEEENIMMVLMKAQEEQQLLSTSKVRTDFQQTVSAANAWYSPDHNSINIPEGILHSPFFETNFPLAAIYGSLGVVLGHEVVHGFDNTGVEFDGNGALNPWLDADSTIEFDAMASCVINQYGAFKGDDGSNVVGEYTQGENIADNGGIRVAYNAYKAHSSIVGEDPRLPTDDLKEITPDQLFFVAFAREFCDNSAITEETLRTDEHSPGKYRVLGTLQNFPAFKSAFNCRADEAYSEQKCEVYCKKK